VTPACNDSDVQGGIPGWNGSSTTVSRMWRDDYVDMGPYAGTTVQFRFDLYTSSVTTDPGVAIDDSW